MPNPLVLLHGALSNGDQLTGLAAALDRPFRCPDLDGHGRRSEAAHDLDAFVRTALDGDAEVDLVGYSLGGYVALAAAITHPERVRRVVTIATKLDWTPEVAALEARRLDHDRLEERAPAFLQQLRGLHPGPGPRAVLEHTARFLTSLGTAAPLGLARVDCPVLVLVGSADGLVTREECERAAATIPQAAMQVIDGAPHQYERMDVDDLARRVGAFLA